MRVAAMVAAVLLAWLAPHVAQAQAVATEAVPCPLKLSWEGEEEGKSYDCSVVIVPENHQTPGERTVELVVMRLKSTTLAPMPDPMVYLSGGPGSSALHEITTNQVLYMNLKQIRARRDVLVYDQRGTGHSQILTCGPFVAALGVIGELFPQVEIADLEAAREKSDSLLTLGICAAGLKSVGVDLAQYNSVASAFDIASLVPALGYEGDYNLYGTSYGTRLALNAMRSTPERIRSVVVDGTVTPDTPNNAHTIAKIQEHYDSVFDACAKDSFCSQNFPDLKARFIAVLTRLNETALAFDPPLVPQAALRPRVGGAIKQIDPAFFATLGKLNNDSTQGGLAAFLPQMIVALEEGDLVTLAAILKGDPAAAGAAATPQVQPVADPEDVLKPDDTFIAPAIELLLALASREVQENERTLSGDLVKLVVQDMNDRLRGGEKQAEVVKALVEFAVIPLGGNDKSALSDYVATHLSPAKATTANAFISAMSAQEVRDTMWAIQDVAEVLTGAGERSGVGIAMGLMFAINCPEDISLTPEQVAVDYGNASPYPGLIVQTVEQYRLYRTACTFFPTPFTAEEMMSPVVSDIPTLIFQSALDTQTPLSLGRRALETLDNGILVVWPSEGHVIAGHSIDGCAGAIAASFMDQPLVQPNLTCMSDPFYSIPFERAAGKLAARIEAAKASAPAAPVAAAKPAAPAEFAIFGDGYPAPGTPCSRSGESDFTREFLDDSADLVACPPEVDAAQFVANLGGEVVATKDGWSLISVPHRAPAPVDGMPSIGSETDLSEFEGARAGQAEMGIQKLGFTAVRSEGLTTYWLNADSGACARITTADGRYAKVEMLAAGECG